MAVRTSIFEVFLRYAALFYLLLILDGFLSNLFYYLIFNISVEDYFSIEDYVNALFTNLWSFLFVAFFLFFPFATDYNEVRRQTLNDLKQKQALNPPKAIQEPTKLGRVMIFMTRFLGIGFMGYCVIMMIKIWKNTDLALLMLVIAGLIGISTYLVVDSLKQEKQPKTKKRLSILITLILAILLIKLFLVLYKGIGMYYSKTNYQKISFYLDNGKTINTSDTTLYLGSSKDYTFFFDKIEKKSVVLRRSTINTVKKVKSKKPDFLF